MVQKRISRHKRERMCVCVQERKRQRERERGKGRGDLWITHPHSLSLSPSEKTRRGDFCFTLRDVGEGKERDWLTMFSITDTASGETRIDESESPMGAGP